MAASDVTAGTLSDAEHDKQLRRALIASTVGTTIEWYDFLLYGTVTGLVFGKLYFPGSDPIVGVLQAFGVFFIGFVGRPIGAAIFGHYGDRIGRKATLIATLLITGLATTAVGFVPTYDSIGIWGAVLLTIIRLIQGIGVGGEWGGSVLLAMEWSRSSKNRGHIASWPQVGGPAGLFLANAAVLLFSWLSGDQFLVWGWRIPFFLSIVMVAVGLWIRLGISETPVFQKVLDEERTERVPVLEVFKRQPKQILLTALLRLPEQGPGYIVAAFIFTYGTTVLGVSRNFLLSAVLVQTVIGFLWVTIAGRLSDRVGRKKMYMIGCVSVGIFGFIYFALLDTMSPTLIFIAVALSFVPIMTMYGPEAALIAEAFSPRLRYSGASLGYQLASIIAGGPSPFIATALFATYHSSLPIALYILACAIVGIISTALLTDYTNKEISAEYEGSDPFRAAATEARSAHLLVAGTSAEPPRRAHIAGLIHALGDLMLQIRSSLLLFTTCVAVSACAASVQNKEDMLAAAGFTLVPANTPQRQMSLTSLPPHKFVHQVRNNVVIYIYADPTICDCLYVGNQAAYDRYRQEVFAKNIADEQAMTAQINEMNWGPWGPGWYY